MCDSERVTPGRSSSASPARSQERARELYKYFTPETLDRRDGNGTSRPDAILMSQAQLVTLRLDVRRCLINFLDSNTQYCVADARKTLHLEDVDRADDPLDRLNSLYTPSNAAHSICHNTMNSKPKRHSSDACFEVMDLSKDVRFTAVPQKAGSEKMTYYCGTPLRTKNGISIGALCIFDDKPRSPMTEDELLFLNVIAKNIICHLELLRDQTERKRASRMSRCLNAFVDPAYHMQNRRRRSAQSQRTSRSGNSSLSPSVGATSPVHSNPGESAFPEHIASNGPTASTKLVAKLTPNFDRLKDHEPEGPQESRIQEADHGKIYTDGADLLCDALHVEGGGGVVFLDVGSSNLLPCHKSSTENGVSPIGNKEQDMAGNMEYQHPAEENTAKGASETQEANVLAATLAKEASFTSPSAQFLDELRKRHPRGRLWVFDSKGNICDSDDEREHHGNPSSEAGKKREAAILRRRFPGARHIMGVPLLDPRTSSLVFCFAWSTSKWRTFNYQIDLLFTIAFCNCIAMEKSRLATMAADQQKGDFIGSISHELRSPLHGILGSCEFLQDTVMSNFQTSLVDTVDSCARTLLDTISMVLDYSKINSFERKDEAMKLGQDGRPALQDAPMLLDQLGTSQAQPNLNIYGNVDLALLTEQVVEGVQSGHIYRDTSTLQFTDVAEKSPDDVQRHISNVEVILEIAPGNWFFVTQPGAFRRIVMNIVGNALKYTSRGQIRIKLERLSGIDAYHSLGRAFEQPDHEGRSLETVKLTVSDTGRGISPDYLRTRLYEPFSQEDTLAVGTGLGLSLVRSILKMLQGNIDVRSTLGVGTTVTVMLPMEKQEPSHDQAPGRQLQASAVSSQDVFATLSNSAALKRIEVFIRDQGPNKTGESVRALMDSVRSCATQWFGREHVTDFSASSDADLIVADESDVDILLKALSTQAETPGIIVLCSNVSRHRHLSKYAEMGRVEFLSKPFGPHKLAKALRAHVLKCAGQSAETDRDRATSMGMKRLVTLTTTPAESSVESCQARRPSLASRRTISASKQELAVTAEATAATTTNMSVAGDAVNPKPTETSIAAKEPLTQVVEQPLTHGPRQPKCLLVDDNHINLKLLETYIKKRKYSHSLTALNGLEAVEAFESALAKGAAPDIIFMDLSMPVMGGLEATRKIREIEQTHHAEHTLGSLETAVLANRSLIVALTGLASGKDQADAFGSGVDIYMTKPLSFKELGRLLDNWEHVHTDT